ncbi:hypothetical protein [Brenneria corticis]|uniref:Co-chaperone DjlA N-terminal domain-containing protein n=1 Tax=Brenneria corticis TaxID=2173106 RepID=A0A2U1UBA0_9GAMM|nr:hypothetical protein [Brenneria sp. CFCC 11842]PWC18956.1 hypothetical protein DDT56_03140 [Brenneria sp. CFCC 11842]QDX98813.1 hypothetical protein EGD00_19815 [Pectobacterium carotovorum subsp. carotovorum]
MLIKLLPDDEKALLLDLARLLALCDKPLLWDGKTKDELTSDSDLNALSIQQGEQENELLSELEQSVKTPDLSVIDISATSIASKLTEKLKAFPLTKIDAAESRVQAATAVLKTLLEEKRADLPTIPKIILFQLILIALRDGNISNIEWSLLKEIQLHYQLQDFIFKDLLDRAEVLNNEISKTIALVLE